MEEKLKFDFKIMQQVINLIGVIDAFRGKWAVIEKKENRYLKQLRHIATIESIGSSTRIEGATLTDEEVEKLLQSVKMTKLKSRDEQEVVGYYEVLDLILESYPDIQLTENYIKQLHGILLRQSTKDNRHRGEYKSLSNQVVANYPGGEQSIIFRTTEPHLVKKEMEELIDWTNREFGEKELHPMLVIGVFVYEFLSIHPFQDGNGRLSRLLTTLLLLKYEYHFIQYVSFEHLIEERKKVYYKALMAGQKNRYKKEEKIDQWIIFFLECVSALTGKLEQKYIEYSEKKAYLNQRQEKILAVIKEYAPVKFSDIVKALPDFSPNTIKKDLAYLVAHKAIEKTGARKGTIYTNS